MNKARLIIDPPATGSWNMAMDQALLQTASEQGGITLRFYQWSEPTLSLGYFQKASDRNSHAASLGCSLVRRTSGGGAILHDNELTYSICVPASNRWSSASTQLYTLVHQVIVDVLGKQGVKASLFSDASPDNKAFLCFQRRTSGDIVIGSDKVCGSAQRRLRNALVQHGSLLVKTSLCSPELAGIENLTQKSLSLHCLTEELAVQIAADLDLKLVHATADPQEIESTRQIENDQFLDQAWTLRR